MSPARIALCATLLAGSCAAPLPTDPMILGRALVRPGVEVEPLASLYKRGFTAAIVEVDMANGTLVSGPDGERAFEGQDFELTSAFRPNYNMAVNLVARTARDGARELMRRSFAQHRTDRAAVRMARGNDR